MIDEITIKNTILEELGLQDFLEVDDFTYTREASSVEFFSIMNFYSNGIHFGKVECIEGVEYDGLFNVYRINIPSRLIEKLKKSLKRNLKINSLV